MMTVKQLKEMINNFEDDRIVIIASESGGGKFSTIDEIEAVRYEEIDGFGEIYVDEFTDIMKESGFVIDELSDSSNASPAIVFWPS